MLRLWDVFDWALWRGPGRFNLKAIAVLFALLNLVLVLTLLCILGPLLLARDNSALQGASPLFLFFAAIGFGFMLIEISQMQRLIVFLGHPTYSLSVVLFSLLLSSGLGSYSTQNVTYASIRGAGLVRLVLLLGSLVAFGLLTPYAIVAFRSSSNPIRILVSVAVLFPLGLFMGMAFPLGMKLAASRAATLTPWLWGINGATSVCASVIGVAIALSYGISASFWTGFACYGIACLAFVGAMYTGRSPRLSP